MTWLEHGQVGDKSAVREFFIGIIFVGINGINNKLGFFYMRVICVWSATIGVILLGTG